MSDRSRRIVRCAIYTRKSSEEGLEQDFNSLQAQREACEAYIKSQRHEGWKLLETAYDDGGFSGGSMERPGLKQLLEDIHARRVDIVVVYKVDRLTRSLADFAKIVETFDSQNVSFVSVTQQFNTTTSMGRLTLNVLLSFAQFEREVTGERIRDKVAASKKKGMWMGGYVPLGYTAIQKRLIINEPEAKLIREIFSLYLKRKNVRLVAEDLQRRKIIRPSTTAKTGRAYGKTNFSRGLLYKMLSNPIYVGEIEHHGERFKSQHEAIVDQKIWHSVQQLLAKNSKERKFPTNAKAPSLLAGLLFDEAGRKWTTSHAAKGSRRYRYYASPVVGLNSKKENLPAGQLENAVINALVSFLKDRAKIIELAKQADTHIDVVSLNKRAVETAGRIKSVDRFEIRECLVAIVYRVVVSEEGLLVEISTEGLFEFLDGRLRAKQPHSTNDENKARNDVIHTLRVPLRRKGALARTRSDESEAVSTYEVSLLKAVARAVSWFDDLRRGKVVDFQELAARERMTASSVARILRLAFLEPAIIEMILQERACEFISSPRDLMRTEDLPSIWVVQRDSFGI